MWNEFGKGIWRLIDHRRGIRMMMGLVVAWRRQDKLRGGHGRSFLNFLISEKYQFIFINLKLNKF